MIINPFAGGSVLFVLYTNLVFSEENCIFVKILNMNTITIQPPKGLSLEKAKIALKNLNFTIIEENDPTKMSKEEFFAMVDKARKEPTKK